VGNSRNVRNLITTRVLISLNLMVIFEIKELIKYISLIDFLIIMLIFFPFYQFISY